MSLSEMIGVIILMFIGIGMILMLPVVIWVAYGFPYAILSIVALGVLVAIINLFTAPR